MRGNIKDKILKLTFTLCLVSTNLMYARMRTLPTKASIRIETMQVHQIQQVRKVFTSIWAELLAVNTPVEQIESMLDHAGFFKDLDTLQSTYFDNNGTFFVLLDKKKVVGMLGVKKIDNDICEGKKLSILKKYRKQGLATQLSQEFLKFAKEHGYKKVRLEVWLPEKQQPALALFKKWGFYEIEQYQSSMAKISMEKVL